MLQNIYKAWPNSNIYIFIIILYVEKFLLKLFMDNQMYLWYLLKYRIHCMLQVDWLPMKTILCGS